jgi:hypothetical protein
VWDGPGRQKKGSKFGGYETEGHAALGTPHGVCKTTWENGDQYHGFYQDGYRYGTHGTMMYGHVARVMRHGVLSWKYDHQFSGRWCLGVPGNRGQTIKPVRSGGAALEKKRVKEAELQERDRLRSKYAAPPPEEGDGQDKDEDSEEEFARLVGRKPPKEKKNKKNGEGGDGGAGGAGGEGGEGGREEVDAATAKAKKVEMLKRQRRKQQEAEEEANRRRLVEQEDVEADRVLKVTGLYTTNGRSSCFPRLHKVAKGESKVQRRFRKKLARDHKTVQVKRDKVAGINYRNYRRQRYRAGLVLEQTGSLMANERKALLEEDQWRAKEKRRLEKVRLGKKARFSLSMDEYEKLVATDERVFDDGFELRHELAKLASDFDMAKIMRSPPTMEELDKKLDDIQWMQEEFEERRWQRRDVIESKMKGLM